MQQFLYKVELYTLITFTLGENPQFIGMLYTLI